MHECFKGTEHALIQEQSTAYMCEEEISCQSFNGHQERVLVCRPSLFNEYQLYKHLLMKCQLTARP